MSWSEISDITERGWETALLRAGAPLHQMPFFTEGLRIEGRTWLSLHAGADRRLSRVLRAHLTAPLNLEWRPAGRLRAYASLVRVGLPGFRAACLTDGPVSLDGEPVPLSAIEDLTDWAGRNGIACIRFQSWDARFLDEVASRFASCRADAVPQYRVNAEELCVALDAGEDQLLARFQKIARQEINKAAAAGFEIRCEAEPGAIDAVWPVLCSESKRKGVSYCSSATYRAIMSGAKRCNAVRLYSAWIEGVPVACILVLKDGVAAHYYMGAIDLEALRGRPSPSCLLHWTAIRDARRGGATRYMLGTRSGTVYNFKQKFRPEEIVRPAPVTVATHPLLFRVWTAGLGAFGWAWSSPLRPGMSCEREQSRVHGGRSQSRLTLVPATSRDTSTPGDRWVDCR